MREENRSYCAKKIQSSFLQCKSGFVSVAIRCPATNQATIISRTNNTLNLGIIYFTDKCASTQQSKYILYYTKYN